MSHQKAQKGVSDFLILLCLLAAVVAQPLSAQTSQRASISIDARKVENRISPLLYGQFLEFMYEGVKGGLHAELIRNRSFEEPPNVIGLSRNWERYPDDRNDDYALTFHWDDKHAYPQQRKEHSLRVETDEGVIERHGIYQPRIPIRSGLEYRGYIWLRTTDYAGNITVALESDSDQRQIYAAANLAAIVRGDWRRYEFSLKPARNDPLARFVCLRSLQLLQQIVTHGCGPRCGRASMMSRICLGSPLSA